MIQLQNVSKRYGQVSAIDALSLELPAGTRTVVHGPSGSGKTTLLRLIAGLEPPSQGEIRIDGELISTPDWIRPPYDRGVGFVFQDPALWPHLTVAKNLAFGILDRPRAEVRARVNEILTTFDLTNLGGRYPNQLSGGQARRVALARTLIVNPAYLLLDEPLTHLHPELKWKLLDEIIDRIEEMNITLLYVTHNQDEAHRLEGRHLKLREGRIEADSRSATPGYLDA